jgi:outer membrane protein assembly factor BamB
LFNDEPTGGYGGIWMSGGAPAADASNNLYVITGNGTYDGSTQFGDSFLKLSTGSSMSVLSFFAPSNQAALNSIDQEVGSGGAAILIDQPSGPVPHLVVGGGKEGKLYLLNRDNLGGNTATDSGAVQTFVAGNAIYATPAFWQNTLYLGLAFDNLKAFSFNTTSGTFTTTPASQSPSVFGYGGATPSVSSQGASNGIVWGIENPATPAAVLHAYDAKNLGTELWNSATIGADQAGQAVKFTVPTVANGKVYVGTASQISVYGLSPN